MTRSALRLVARRLTIIGYTITASVAAACSPDHFTAPVASPAASVRSPVAALNRVKDSLKALGQSVAIAEGLLWEQPLNQPISVSELITPKGGKIEIKELGLKIDVPKNAVLSDLRITVTALPGNVVAYEFQPHGTRFLQPLQFEQSLKNTNWEKKDIKTTLWGAYFADPNQLINGTDLAVVNEWIETLVLGNKVRFDIWHFSGYMVSTGRAHSLE